MTHNQALLVLELDSHADIADIKKAYRRLAFALHPDLNPGKPQAGADFQRLNEAYVLLCEKTTRTKEQQAEAEATDKVRAEARKAYTRAQAKAAAEGAAASRPGSRAASSTSPRNAPPGAAGYTRNHTYAGPSEESVLRDLLRDPFARRVFEDIYSQIRHDSHRHKQTSPPRLRNPMRNNKKGPLAKAFSSLSGTVNDWLQRQIDDEQTVYVPAESLRPGMRLRLQIHHGLRGKPQTIEVTLPPEFQTGRPIRLKKLGKRLGSWQGDLYLTVLPKG